jgi:hypothetical protein
MLGIAVVVVTRVGNRVLKTQQLENVIFVSSPEALTVQAHN